MKLIDLENTIQAMLNYEKDHPDARFSLSEMADFLRKIHSIELRSKVTCANCDDYSDLAVGFGMCKKQNGLKTIQIYVTMSTYG